MADTPIPEQSGLSQDDLNKMKPVEQKYKPVGNDVMAPQMGVNPQREMLKNKILKALISYEKKRADASKDPKNDHNDNDAIDSFVNDLTDIIADTIKAESWTVTTNVNTSVVVPAYTGVINGVGSGTASNVQVTSE